MTFFYAFGLSLLALCLPFWFFYRTMRRQWEKKIGDFKHQFEKEIAPVKRDFNQITDRNLTLLEEKIGELEGWLERCDEWYKTHPLPPVEKTEESLVGVDSTLQREKGYTVEISSRGSSENRLSLERDSMDFENEVSEVDEGSKDFSGGMNSLLENYEITHEILGKIHQLKKNRCSNQMIAYSVNLPENVIAEILTLS